MPGQQYLDREDFSTQEMIIKSMHRKSIECICIENRQVGSAKYNTNEEHMRFQGNRLFVSNIEKLLRTSRCYVRGKGCMKKP